MNEDVELIIEETRDRMEKALSHLEHELSRLRAGRSNPALLDGITVDYYGVNTPLNQVSNINTPDPKTILIQPWEKSMLSTIEKAIMAANIGLTPVNNGEVIRINIPPLTEESMAIEVNSDQLGLGARATPRHAHDQVEGLKGFDGAEEHRDQQ